MSDSPVVKFSRRSVSLETVPSSRDANAESDFHPTRLGPFQTERVLGKGAMGLVLAARHAAQDVPVAIKIITRKGADHPRFRQALRNEVQAVAALSHPAIVRVLDFGEISREVSLNSNGFHTEGTPYYVMEHIAEGTLYTATGKVSWRQARDILLTLLDALAHAHAAGVIHRDIKPGNILLGYFSSKMIPMLADFGLAFAMEKAGANTRSIGTPSYMAPEQFSQPWRTHGPWSDLYSLGCVAFELLSGFRPFLGDSTNDISEAHRTGRRRVFQSVLRLPDGLDAWFDRMLAPNAKDRFQSAAEAAQALAALDDSQLPDVFPPNALRRPIGRITPVLDVFWNARKAHAHLGRLTAEVQYLPGTAIPSEWNTPRYDPLPARIVGAGMGVFGLRVPPLVGRQQELDILWEAFCQAVTQKSVEVVNIQGAQGSGRSRLGDWFVQRVQELAAARVMRAKHSTAGHLQDGLSGMLGRHFRVLGANHHESLQIIRRNLSLEGLDSDYDVQGLSAMATEASLPHTSQFTFGSAKQRHLLLVTLIKQMAARTPVILWIDDAQWGEDCLEFVATLQGHLKDTNCSVLVVLSLASETLAEKPVVQSLCNNIQIFRQIELQALNPHEHLRMIQDLLHLHEDLAMELSARTLGNPRMAVDLMSDWVARGRLVVAENGFALAHDATLEIPFTLREVWESRIDDLITYLPDAEHTLYVAAAIGQEVLTFELESLCDTLGVVYCTQLIPELVRRKFATLTDGGFVFTHALLCEVVESKARRKTTWNLYVAAVANFVESHYDIRNPQNAERVGKYLMAAQQYSRAAELLFQSAQGRRHLGQFRAAQQLIMTVLKCLESIPAGEDDPRWGNAWTLRAHTYLNQNDLPSAMQWATHATAQARQHGWNELLPYAQACLAFGGQVLGTHDAESMLNEATKNAKNQTQTFPAVMGMVVHLLSTLRRFDEASELLELAFVRVNDPRERAMNHYYRARIAAFEEDWPTLMEHATQAVQHFEEIHHFPGVAQNLEYIAEYHRKQGRLDEASAIYRRCMELQKMSGYPIVISQLNLGVILLDRHGFEEAEQLFMLAEQTLRAMGRRRLVFHAIAGRIAATAGTGVLNTMQTLCESLTQMMDQGMETEPEIAVMLEQAGDLLLAQNLPLAEIPWELAKRQFEFLKDDQAQIRLTRKLEQLDFILDLDDV